MPELKSFLDALSSASKSVLGIVGYLGTLLAWSLIAWRVMRHGKLLRHIQKLPSKDRLEAIRMEMGYIPVPKGLTAEQWLRYRIHLLWVIGFIVAVLCIAFLLVISWLHSGSVGPSPQGTNHESSNAELFQTQPNVRVTYLRFENTLLLDQVLKGYGFSPESGFLTQPFWVKNGVYKDLTSILSNTTGQPTARRAYDVFTLAAQDRHGKQLWFLDATDGKITSPLTEASGGEKSFQQIYQEAFPRRGPHLIGAQDIDDLFSKVGSDPYWQIDLNEGRSNVSPIPFDGYSIFGFPDNQKIIRLVKDPISLQVLNANPDIRDVVALIAFGIHGAYYGEIWIREIKLLTVDIENTGDRPIGLATLKEKITESASLYKIRSLKDNQRSLAGASVQDQPLPLEALRPGEHLIVPLQIELGLADQIPNHRNWNYERYLNDEVLPKKWWLSRTESDFDFQILRSTDSAGNPNTDIRRLSRSTLERKPDVRNLMTATYVIGQSIDVRQIIFKTGNGTLTPHNLRRFDPNNLLVRGAYEAGSCPILLWKQVRDEQWFRHGRVLVDAVTSKNKITESIPIGEAAEVFSLSEEEDETTFLNRVRLLISDGNGYEHMFSPVSEQLKNAQGSRYFRLEPGEHLEFHFDIPEELRRFNQRKLLITGYYVPHSLMSK